MSPAGYWPQLSAAIEAGADSVYFGLNHFSARAKTGFSVEELPEAMRTLHARGVRGFITFNTLVFEEELREAARAIEVIAEAGADALIVQDLGIAQLAARIAPGLELHASTQMSITSAEGARVAQKLGAKRVTLARELSLEEIRAIRAGSDCELEMFVHGALCVAYSGQCLSSEAWGGRSANRGQCAQACRLPYQMLVDGEERPLGDARYLLSPGDLYTLRQIPEIVEIGVAALKIEGRYKDAEYVALTTAAYRRAVDEAWAGSAASISCSEEMLLEQAYSRGLGPHFVTGTNHQAVVNGRAPRHRGVLMGRVVAVGADRVTILAGEAQAVAPLKPGDGVVFDAADWRSPEEPEEGGRVYSIEPRRDGTLDLVFGNRAISFSRIREGDLLWRTHDPEVSRAAKPYTAAVAPVSRQPVDVRVTARVGEPLSARWSLARRPEVSVTVNSGAPLGVALNQGLSAEALRRQFERLGNTAYQLAGLDVDMDGNPFAPASLLNQLRRQAVASLEAAQRVQPSIQTYPPVWREARPLATAAAEPAELHLLIRTPEQLEAALDFAPASITLDYLDLFGLRPSIARVKSAGISARVASPRILKPGESRIVDFLVSLDCAILLRPIGMLEMIPVRHRSELVGDASLNAANSETARFLLDSGLSRLTPAHDLHAEQIARLAASVGPGQIEVVAYQHLPVFHTEHCVFCRFLSSGTSYRDCGRPCETHRLALRDPHRRAHPVLADVGCRNTVFGAEAQEASAHLERWRAAGISRFRLEFVHESPEQVVAIAGLFRETLERHLSLSRLTRELKRFAPQGVTEGSLLMPAESLVTSLA